MLNSYEGILQVITKENPYCYIYYDLDMIPFYVGKGNDKRVYKHLTESLENTDNPEKVKEIQKILELGQKPIIKIIYTETDDEAFELEEFLTYHWELRIKGGVLTNLIYGGKNGYMVGIAGIPKSEEHKKKISESNKKYAKEHPEWVKFHQNKEKGIPKSQATKEHMSQTKIKLFQEHPELHPRLGKKQSKHSIQVSTEFNSNTWEVTFPDQHKETIKNLKQFCKKHNINNGNLVAIGKASGYKAINLNPKQYKKKSQKTKDAIAQARSKKFKITFPDGHTEIISNLSKWCKNNKINKSDLYTFGHTKGYSATKIT